MIVKQMISIQDKKYCLDINRISDFVNYSDSHLAKESEIIDTYGINNDAVTTNYKGIDVVSKSIREVTTQGNVQLDNIRYDLIKTLITQIMGFDYDENKYKNEIPFGLEIALNTLIKEGFLIEIN